MPLGFQFGSQGTQDPWVSKNDRKITENNKKQPKITLKMPQKCLKITPYVPLYSLKGPKEARIPGFPIGFAFNGNLKEKQPKNNKIA